MIGESLSLGGTGKALNELLGGGGQTRGLLQSQPYTLQSLYLVDKGLELVNSR